MTHRYHQTLSIFPSDGLDRPGIWLLCSCCERREAVQISLPQMLHKDTALSADILQKHYKKPKNQYKKRNLKELLLVVVILVLLFKQ